MKNKNIAVILITLVLIVIVIFIGTTLSDSPDNQNENETPDNGSEQPTVNDNDVPYSSDPEIIEEEPLPEGAERFSSNINVIDTAKSVIELEPFTTALSSTSFNESLTNENLKFTIFAPSDTAFVQAADTLSNFSSTYLSTTLGLHIAEANILNADIEDGLKILTLTGIEIEVIRDEEGLLLLKGPKNTARLLAVDLVGSNGVVHIIDTVLLP